MLVPQACSAWDIPGVASPGDGLLYIVGSDNKCIGVTNPDAPLPPYSVGVVECVADAYNNHFSHDASTGWIYWVSLRRSSLPKRTTHIFPGRFLRLRGLHPAGPVLR